MASDFFLSVETKKGGFVKGESQSDPVRDQINVRKFTIALNSPTDYDDQAAGRVQLEHAEFEFDTSLATTPLFSTLCNNDVIKQATLTCRKTGTTGKHVTFLQWRFHQARLVSFKNSGEGENVSDTIKIAYAAIEVWYGQQKHDGSVGNGMVSCYDAGENAMGSTTLPDPKPK